MFETFDVNEVKLTGKVVSTSAGTDDKGRPFLNMYIGSQGKKYSELLHVSFFGDYSEKVKSEVHDGDRVFVSAKLIGKKVVDEVRIKLVGNFYLKLA